MSEVKTPWEPFMGGVPMHLNYFEGTMYDAVENIALQYPSNIALDFLGAKTTYRRLIINIKKVAASLLELGVKKEDRVTIAMPNCPQAIYMFYACNFIGAVANMIHPLSAENEIDYYIKESKSNTILTLDTFYLKVKNVVRKNRVKNFILTTICDGLKGFKKEALKIVGKQYKDVPKDGSVIRWARFLRLGKDVELFKRYQTKDDIAVILYSGGTTGVSKGVGITNLNINACAQQIIATNPMYVIGDRMLAAMPIFHGFGLAVCVHAMLTHGGRSVLVPRFTPNSYGLLMAKKKCNFIAGVPSLFEALLRSRIMRHKDLSNLKGVYSGGDTLSIELKHRFDNFLKEHGANVSVREGYGAAECISASCLTPFTNPKEGSIGIPFPDTYYKIVEPGTDKELPYNSEGEILISGVTVMKEYVGHPEETARTLRVHEDGRTWLYTGDLGMMDEDGYVYFKGRIKRMIVSRGYNIYPAQIENILEKHKAVQMSCVIGVKDPYKMFKVKAFVTLKEGFKPSLDLKNDIINHCKKEVAKYAVPYDIEFRNELPKTVVGKVAYRVLEKEENDKITK